MKSLKNQVKDAAALCIILGAACVVASLSGCGKQGPAGANGQSIVGPQGVAGAVGSQGLPGTSCTETTLTPSQATPNGGALLTCGNSSTVITNGSNGLQGIQGVPGQNATSVNVVQFCSAYTTTYPSSFPEQAVCVGNELLAVYWDGTNAWLAEVVPGYYASTSTTAPCDFTVGTDCKISN
jgi:hypothetical protein